MRRFAGIDLGAHNLRFFVADERGVMKDEHIVVSASPFRKTGKELKKDVPEVLLDTCLLYTSPSPRDRS